MEGITEEGGGFILYDPHYQQTSFCALQDMRDKGEYTDVTITCGTREFPAHRVVLAARIPCFRKILSSIARTISLDEINPCVLESIINFAYEGKLKVTAENVKLMLLASGYFQLGQVHKACWEFLSKKFCSSSEYSAYAKPVPSDASIRNKFDDFCNTEEFLFLPYTFVKELLARDDLIVKGEEKVFEALIKWIKVSPVERQSLLPHLLAEIRMANLTPDYLVERVETERLIQESDQCKHMVEEAKNYHLLPRKRSMFLGLNTDPRVYTNCHQDTDRQGCSSKVATLSNIKDGLYVVCCQNSLGTSVSQYDHENNQWAILPSSATDEIVHGAVFIDGKIYVFFQNSLRALCLRSREWTAVWDLPVAVNGSGIAACALTSKIYIFGGRYLLNKVRCFDVRLGEWQQSEEMPLPRRNMGVAFAGKYVYLTGGFVLSCSNIFDEYHSITKVWTALAPMLSNRMCHGSTELNNKLYVCGGLTNNDQILNTAEVYNKNTKQWISIASPKSSWRSLSLVSWDGKLYGFVVERSSNCCLIYEPEKDTWICHDVIRPEGGHSIMKAVVVCSPE